MLKKEEGGEGLQTGKNILLLISLPREANISTMAQEIKLHQIQVLPKTLHFIPKKKKKANIYLASTS